jgi:hypothetical protein
MRPADDIAAELNDVGGPDERRSLIEQSSKPSCLIVDFVGNAGRHKLMTTADVLGGNITDAAIEAAIARARRPGGKPVRMDEALLEEQQAEQEARRLESEARRNRIVARADYLLTKIDPFDVLQLQPTKARGWESGKKFSEKQSAMLRRNGVDPMKIEFHKGKQLLDAIFERIEHNLCSVGQMKVLKRAGVKTEISFRAASAAIDVLSRNGWRNSADVQRAIDAASGDAPPPRPQRVPEEDNVPF